MPELDRRRKAVVVVFSLLIAVTCAAVISGILELGLMNRIVAGEEVTASEADANDARQAIVGLLQFAIWIAAVVVFIRWMHLAYKRLAPEQRRYGTGWAIGGWFVPILNLWRPKQVFNDIWEAGRGDTASPLPNLWWAAFLITNWVANFSLRAAFKDDTPEQLRDGTIAYLVSDSLDVVAAVLALLAVSAATRRLGAGDAPAAVEWSAPERPDGLAA